MGFLDAQPILSIDSRPHEESEMKLGNVFVLAATFCASLSWGGQDTKALRVECKFQEIELYQTASQSTVTEFRIHPKFNQENLQRGEDSVVLYEDAGFKVGARLAHMPYTPELTTYVLIGEVLVETGIQASVTHPKTGHQIVIACATRR